MKTKHFAFFGLLIIYYLICTFKVIQVTQLESKYECGTVIEDFTELCSVKHGTITEYYLKIQFKDEVKVERVTAQTFYDNHKVGSFICLEISNDVPLWAEIGSVVGSFVLGIIIIGFTVFWLTDSF